MQKISIDIQKTGGFISLDEVKKQAGNVLACQQKLHDKSGAGNDFLGWMELPEAITSEELKTIKATADRLSEQSDVVVVTGIGGSYLGARAVIDALSNSFDFLMADRKRPVVLYAGQNIGEDYSHELLELLKDKSFSVVVISKSGTTTEPAIAFRLLKELLEKKHGANEVKNRIVAITDESKGALRTLADREGYQTYVIPDDVGGRFSVLTPVGLLPIAVAGFDIEKLVEGARDMVKATAPDVSFEDNPAAVYAAARNLLYQSGKKTEILVNYHPKLHFLAEWWKQLYGESEGKENKGIFPAAVDFTTDLHSMGQWIQEGERTIFETVISVENSNHTVKVPSDKDDLDSLNYIAGKRVDEVNKMAELGTLVAHVDGGVPNIRISVPQLNEYFLGQLIFFFEKACGISGYVLGVNPFDQPGVEAYKKNMFALLGKPGFEKETEEIRKKL
ncbi:glucose-6-phosphate isomerase [Alkalitalea saponilacus]|uniref:Glucose-6-phosphate isomerase n=1 Tax=Alkalitalea saponilacus TaxID=889453 RepID=A0A1T5A2A5_9BACT|nr:glucose-6-phosphate isomerase [Alkalitalea saponilacus]ASB48891.1 glucose-6-phosphate isomerase [Alkalitalea saponilacus]SKB29151.1 glucose-6-phosphate isomerase [Alkalitalea saponilacus]